MFEGTQQIAPHARATGEDGLRRVGWAELAAAISLSRTLHREERGLLATAGPSFDGHQANDERGVNLSSLASRKASGDTAVPSADPTPGRHRENR